MLRHCVNRARRAGECWREARRACPRRIGCRQAVHQTIDLDEWLVPVPCVPPRRLIVAFCRSIPCRHAVPVHATEAACCRPLRRDTLEDLQQNGSRSRRDQLVGRRSHHAIDVGRRRRQAVIMAAFAV